MTADWENFVASLDPAAVERERMRTHGDLDEERPGSRADHEMRFAHDYVRAERALLEAESEEERRQRHDEKQIADADREIRARGFDQAADDSDIEAAIRSYSQQHHGRTAA
ncbi:hypothetical protein [Curtobacterium sp. UCD-KPL2560]|uniref:hypothetical protein n=1 Tax=Curtobacterium sp. UCD-KPL2560 TaxID=1885315 RepID=UPI000825F771|nr:hypothetical protein [Curtobacterium sp. UCD-KPL2560]